MSDNKAQLATATVDRLGARLRQEITDDDLRLLDRYRNEFRPDYDTVVNLVRERLGRSVSGRPAKSTTSIVDKLNRSSMRLSQMQDVAGCRVIVEDSLEQLACVDELRGMVPYTLVDRRVASSHGYRAVHVIARPARRPIEIQVRTMLQHLWAEMSEKAADSFGLEVKYGSGDAVIRVALDVHADLIAGVERLELAAAGKTTDFTKELESLRFSLEASLNESIFVFEGTR